jgi:ATP-dependent Clp protease ATP-binding subunit ClpA
MFERFTDRARRVVVLAQEEARTLQHNFIGTEHLLLGLLGEPDGIAARGLGRFGLTLSQAREDVTARVSPAAGPVKGRIPFTPRAKKVMEFALREALALRHNYIGTEHLLLGLIRDTDGAGAQILLAHGADPAAVRQAVLDLVPAGPATPGHRWLRRRPDPGGEPARPAGADEGGQPDGPATTPAAEAGLAAAARLAGDQPVGSHHLLLATLADPDTAAARALAGLGVDLDQAREALRTADVTDTSDEPPAERGRRHMLLKVTDGRLTIEATDPEILRVARGTLQVLGEGTAEPGTISGDRPAAASLAQVWQALRDSLEDILRRAMAARDTPDTPDTSDTRGAAGSRDAGGAAPAPADQPPPGEG